MSDQTEPEGGWRRLVCIGLRLDTRNHLAIFFHDEEGNRYGWRKPVLGPAGPGLSTTSPSTPKALPS